LRIEHRGGKNSYSFRGRKASREGRKEYLLKKSAELEPAKKSVMATAKEGCITGLVENGAHEKVLRRPKRTRQVG